MRPKVLNTASNGASLTVAELWPGTKTGGALGQWYTVRHSSNPKPLYEGGDASSADRAFAEAVKISN